MIRYIRFAKYLFRLVITPFFLSLGFIAALAARFASRPEKPRLVFGPVPIITNVYWAKALREGGYNARTFMDGYYPAINKADDFDILIQNRFGRLPGIVKYYLAFLESLFKFDVFVLTFSGFFLGKTPLWKFESFLLKLARKNTIVLPYGADAYVYRRLRSVSALNGMLTSYPAAARTQAAIAQRVDYWCHNADLVFTGIMGTDGLGRWDALLPVVFFIDTTQWQATPRRSDANGVDRTVYIAHAPNHRGCKGTEFIIDAIERLKAEGLKVELLLIQKIQNSEVKDFMRDRVDILVDQLVLTGFAMNALEGMATGLPVIANVEDKNVIDPFRYWSYFDECPLVSASPATLVEQLRKLVVNPGLRHEIGAASRLYIEKYQSFEAARYLFTAALDYLAGRRTSLMDIYHPLGIMNAEITASLPRIEHPLVNNKIV